MALPRPFHWSYTIHRSSCDHSPFEPSKQANSNFLASVQLKYEDDILKFKTNWQYSREYIDWYTFIKLSKSYQNSIKIDETVVFFYQISYGRITLSFFSVSQICESQIWEEMCRFCVLLHKAKRHTKVQFVKVKLSIW